MFSALNTPKIYPVPPKYRLNLPFSPPKYRPKGCKLRIWVKLEYNYVMISILTHIVIYTMGGFSGRCFFFAGGFINVYIVGARFAVCAGYLRLTYWNYYWPVGPVLVWRDVCEEMHWLYQGYLYLWFKTDIYICIYITYLT